MPDSAASLSVDGQRVRVRAGGAASVAGVTQRSRADRAMSTARDELARRTGTSRQVREAW